MTQTSDRSTTQTRRNPYPGPRTFRKEEHNRFYGREREARELLAFALSERLLLFYAQSGAGKSSLINARIIRGLEQEGHEVLPVGRVSGVDGADLPDGANVFIHNLMISLDSALGEDGMLPGNLTLADFLLHFDREENGTYRYHPPQEPASEEALSAFDLDDLDLSSLPSLHRTLIIDQFEEILTTNLSAWEQRPAFFRQLAQSMEADPYLSVILVLREDYVAGLDPYAHLLPGRLKARYYMERMAPHQAYDAVTLPAQDEGVTFEPAAAQALVDNLRQIRIGPEETAPDQYVEPVQLQVVCYQLWQQLAQERGSRSGRSRGFDTITLDDLTRLAGGRSLAEFVNRALMNFYEDVLTAVLADPAVKEQYPQVSERFLRQWFSEKLITEAGTRSFVHEGAQETEGMPNLVVRLLRSRYLIRAENRAGSLWYELVHDRFVDPIRESNLRWRETYRNPLALATEEWLASGRSSAKLAAGDRLRELQRYAEVYAQDTTAEERNFLAESLRRQQEITRRRRNTIAGVGIAGLLLLMLTVVAVRYAFLADEARRNADQERDRAERTAEIAKQREAEAVSARREAEAQRTAAETQRAAADAAAQRARVGELAAQAQAALPEKPQRSLLLALETLNLAKGEQVGNSSAARQALHNALTQIGGVPLQGHAQPIDGMVLSRDGRWLVTAGGPQVRTWDLADPATPTAVDLQGAGRGVSQLQISPNGRTLAALDSYRRSVLIWDLSRPLADQAPIRLASDQEIDSVFYSNRGRYLIVRTRNGEISLYSADDGFAEPPVTLQRTIAIHTPIAVSSNETWLAAVSSPDAQTDGPQSTVLLWRLDDPEAPPLEIREDQHVGIPYLRITNTWLIAAAGRHLRLRALEDVSSEPEPFVLPANESVSDLQTSDNGRWLIVWTWSGPGSDAAYLFDLRTAHPLAQPEKLLNQGSLNAYAFSPNGRWLAASTSDRETDQSNNHSLRLWDLRQSSSSRPIVLQGHTGRVTSLSFSPDSRHLITGGIDQTVRVWDLSKPTFRTLRTE